MEQKKQKQPARSVLGRGLSALISSAPVQVLKGPQEEGKSASEIANIVHKTTFVSDGQAQRLLNGEQAGGSGVQFLALSALVPNPKQPRQDFTESELAELSESIRTLGVLQPILVRPSSAAPGSYEIVAGERRWRASQRASLQTVPVLIRNLDDRETLEISIVENIQRENLNPIEQAQAYQRLHSEFNLSQQEVAERVGKDRASVANFLRLLKLPPEVIDLLKKGDLSMGHAKAILSVREPSVQLSLARKVIKEDLSVRDLEAIVSRVVVLDTGKRAKAKRGAGGEDQPFPDVVDRLRGSLGTKVLLRHTKAGAGKIEIEYFSEAELDRLVEHLCKA